MRNQKVGSARRVTRLVGLPFCDEGNIACRTWDEVGDVSITHCRLNSLGEEWMFHKKGESKRFHKGDVQHQTAVTFSVFLYTIQIESS